MMKSLFKMLLLCLFTIFVSCEKGSLKSDSLEGHCSNSLKISEERVIFDKKGGDRDVNISGKFRFTDFRYNGEHLNFEDGSKDIKIIKEENIVTYKHIDFTVKTFDSIISVTMNENKGEERKLYIGVARGNCFSGFTVEQTGN